jgi:transcriptional regulator with XRE-family HTH domain
VAETTDNTFPFPLTQEELAAATGMTPSTSIARSSSFAPRGLLILREDHHHPDPKRLQKVAQYEANYSTSFGLKIGTRRLRACW